MSNRPWAARNQAAHVAIAKTPQRPVRLCMIVCSREADITRPRPNYVQEPGEFPLKSLGPLPSSSSQKPRNAKASHYLMRIYFLNPQSRNLLSSLMAIILKLGKGSRKKKNKSRRKGKNQIGFFFQLINLWE